MICSMAWAPIPDLTAVSLSESGVITNSTAKAPIAGNGDVYVGDWADNKQDGQGTYTYANGTNYIGAWKEGVKDGQGTYRGPNGSQYIGNWKNNKQDGQGTLTFADSGNTYIGAFKQLSLIHI